MSLPCNNDNDLKQLRGFLMKEESTLMRNLNVLDESLAVINPANQSLIYTFLLSARATGKIDPGKFLPQVITLINNCSANQIHHVAAKFSHICRKFAEVMIELNQAIRAIKPLRNAIKKLRTTSERLTPIHADFLQVCLLAKCYSAALQVLDEEIFEVTSDSAVIPKDMLLFYYYGGLVFTGLKQFKKALDSFRMVITAPSVVLSSIMVEGYKKYVLLSLLVHGKLGPLPRYTSSMIQRFHKTAFSQYHEFATAFANGNTDELHKVAEQYAEVFQKDKNFGLVKQGIQSLYRKNIQRLTQTYLTFSLKDIASSVKLSSIPEAEKQVLKMIESGEIFATISQKDGMVAFKEDPEQYDTNQMLLHLDRQIQKTIDLGKKVRAQDENIASSQIYIQKTSLYERGGGRWNEFDEFFEGPNPSEKVPGKMV